MVATVCGSCVRVLMLYGPNRDAFPVRLPIGLFTDTELRHINETRTLSEEKFAEVSAR